jgi:hypothetical protein
MSDKINPPEMIPSRRSVDKDETHCLLDPVDAFVGSPGAKSIFALLHND